MGRPIAVMNAPSNFHCAFCQEFNIQTIAIMGQCTGSTGALVKDGRMERLDICHACSVILAQQIQDTWTDKLLGLGG